MIPRPKNDSDYLPYSDLLEIFGYVDPCPGKGANNKGARKLRNSVARLIHKKIKEYRDGTITEDAGGGEYYKTPTYYYNGKWYA